LAIASASDAPSTTLSWISFHWRWAAGLEASLWRMTSARLSGTPAASKLESRPREVLEGARGNALGPER
jgi:hypothetical protein